MRRLRTWLLRLGELSRKDARERELAAELESHIQLHIEDNLRAGMTAAQARREALMKLGGVEQTKENYRDRRGPPAPEMSFSYISHSLTTMLKNICITYDRGLTARPAHYAG